MINDDKTAVGKRASDGSKGSEAVGGGCPTTRQRKLGGGSRRGDQSRYNGSWEAQGLAFSEKRRRLCAGVKSVVYTTGGRERKEGSTTR